MGENNVIYAVIHYIIKKSTQTFFWANFVAILLIHQSALIYCENYYFVKLHSVIILILPWKSITVNKMLILLEDKLQDVMIIFNRLISLTLNVETRLSITIEVLK